MSLREPQFLNGMKQAKVVLALPVVLALWMVVPLASAEGDSSIESLYLPKASRLLALVVSDPGNSAVRRRLAAEYKQSKVCDGCGEFFLLTARYLEGEEVIFDSTTVFRQQQQTTFLLGPGHKVRISTSLAEQPSPQQHPYSTQAEELASDLSKELAEDYTAWREVAHKAQLALEKHGWRECTLLQVLSHAWLYGWIFQNQKLGAEKAELAVRIVFQNANAGCPSTDRSATDLYFLAGSLSFQQDHVSAFVAAALAVDYARRWESTGSETPESFIKRVTAFANKLEKLAQPYRRRRR